MLATITSAACFTLALASVPTTGAHAESVLRIAMTAGDIPDWTGQPDQGFEGYRFVGFNLYDGLVNWDLSHSDSEVDATPGARDEMECGSKAIRRNGSSSCATASTSMTAARGTPMQPSGISNG